MREDDKPKDLALRDILFDKIKGSSSMAFDLRYYRDLSESDPNKSYDLYLMAMMARTVSVEREERNRLDKAKGINQLTGSKALAAENTTKKDDKPKPTPKAKADAAPVLPKPNPKMHNEQEKGKGKYEKGKVRGKGKDKSRGRSPSQDRKSMPCIYQFQKGGCSKGKGCPFSHSKKKAPRGSSLGPGNGKGGTQRMIVPHLQDRKVRNHVSCMQKESVIVLTVHTNMTMRLLLPRMDQRKPKLRLPNRRPRLR